MSTKPTTLPTWATTAGTTVEPSAGQKAAGFAVATRPPARWVNWLFKTIYDWCAYVNDHVSLHTQQILTSSSGTYSTPANCVAIRVRAWGGGGAGGGASISTGTSSAGSGGNSGGYSEVLVPSPGASYSYAVGEGGAGSSGAIGGDGAPTTFGSVLTAVGGKGGSVGGATLLMATEPYASVNGTQVGDFGGGSSLGGTGLAFTNTGAYAGVGASSPLGVGGQNGGGAAGGSATGKAAGGGGAAGMNDASAYAGGAGSAGLIIVDEYY